MSSKKPRNCPHCGVTECKFIKWGKTAQRRTRYRCPECKKTFTNRTGTIRYRSQVSDAEWKQVIKMYAMRSCPSGSDIGRYLERNRKTGQRIIRLLRGFMPPAQAGPALSGIVEIDESVMQKQWIVGAKSRRTGKLKLYPVRKRDMRTLEAVVEHACTYNATAVTDEWKGYNLLKYRRPHYTICHAKEFTDSRFPEIHTQSIEGVWGNAKPIAKHTHRGYHQLSGFLNRICFLHNFTHHERTSFLFSLAFPHFTNTKLV